MIVKLFRLSLAELAASPLQVPLANGISGPILDQYHEILSAQTHHPKHDSSDPKQQLV